MAAGRRIRERRAGGRGGAAPRLADLAAARLRPGRRELLGPDFDELVTDRSDASGTAYWSPTTGDYDRDLLVRALGQDAALPRVLGPGESAGKAAGT